jgi:hypothetical protein
VKAYVITAPFISSPSPSYMKKSILASALAAFALTAVSSQAAVIVSEVNPTGSSNSTYAADWFEITNTGSTAVDVTGWKIDDSSNSFASSVPMVGVTIIAPGQSAVFVEGTATTATSFVNAWFNGNAPSGFLIGSYTGSGVGLSSGGDAVNVFDSAGSLKANVSFGASTTGVSFDNAAGLTGVITALSSVGTNGAFTSFAGSETGSPGAVPEASSAMALLASLGLVLRRRR